MQNTYNWTKQFAWFVIPLLVLSFLILFDLYPTEWIHINSGIHYIITYVLVHFKMDPFTIVMYPKLYEASLNIFSIYGMTYLGYNLKLLLIYFLTTEEMDKAIKRSKLRNNIKDCLLRRKHLNQKIDLHKFNIGTIDENIKKAEEELKNLDM